MAYVSGSNKRPYPWKSTDAGFKGPAALSVQSVYDFVELMVGMIDGKVTGFQKIPPDARTTRTVKEAADGVFNSIWVIHGMEILNSAEMGIAGVLCQFCSSTPLEVRRGYEVRSNGPNHSTENTYAQNQVLNFIREQAVAARTALDIYRRIVISKLNDGPLIPGAAVPLSNTAVICHATLAAMNSINIVEDLVLQATERYVMLLEKLECTRELSLLEGLNESAALISMREDRRVELNQHPVAGCLNQCHCSTQYSTARWTGTPIDQ